MKGRPNARKGQRKCLLDGCPRYRGHPGECRPRVVAVPMSAASRDKVDHALAVARTILIAREERDRMIAACIAAAEPTIARLTAELDALISEAPADG